MRLSLRAAAFDLHVAALALLVAGPALSAPKPAAWTRDFAAPVEWQRVTSLGQLVVSTSAGLHAVDPATGDVVWTQTSLKGLPEDGFQELPGSPIASKSRSYVGRVSCMEARRGVYCGRWHTLPSKGPTMSALDHLDKASAAAGDKGIGPEAKKKAAELRAGGATASKPKK